jgi:hypothetical protein
LRTLFGAVMTLAASVNAFGWSAPGHEAIARAALNMVGLSTREKVESILEGESVEESSTWLDHVRDLSRGRYRFPDAAEQKAAVQFNRDFKGNADWHFVNYPVGLTAYHPSGKFSSEHDVVHGIQRAIAVLEGANSKMSKRQALRVLIHLVGDIHQPLHCVTGYFDISDLSAPRLLKPSEVKEPKETIEDRGGNQLYYTKTQELHAMWDRLLPEAITKDPAELLSAISVSNLQAQPVTAGDYHQWAETWASESMKDGKAAYEGLVFESAEYLPDPKNPGKTELHINTKIPGATKGYKAAQKDRTEEQLRRAAVHLAQLLGSIKFP